MFLNEDGSYELEGSMDSLTLPKNLNQSIRLRLSTCAENDPHLALLLSLMAVLGGSCTLSVVTSAWRVLAPDGHPGDITASIAKALKHKFVKFLSASGAQRAGSRRRSSAAGDAQNRWAFHHRAISPSLVSSIALVSKSLFRLMQCSSRDPVNTPSAHWIK